MSNQETPNKKEAGNTNVVRNKTSGNPFADGDGGGSVPNNSGLQKLDKSSLDPHVKFLLRHYLDIAHPVHEQETQTITVKGKDGSTNEVKKKKPVFKGYQFYSVNGKTFNEWLTENVGPGYEVDVMTKEIYKKGNVTNTKTG